MNPSSKTQRWEVFFSGHVQGVGFRFRTQTLAQNYDVRGWVANRSQGDVQLVIEGPKAELDGLVAEIRETMSGHIRQVDIHEKTATGEYGGFEIRRG